MAINQSREIVCDGRRLVGFPLSLQRNGGQCAFFSGCLLTFSPNIFRSCDSDSASLNGPKVPPRRNRHGGSLGHPVPARHSFVLPPTVGFGWSATTGTAIDARPTITVLCLLRLCRHNQQRRRLLRQHPHPHTFVASRSGSCLNHRRGQLMWYGSPNGSCRTWNGAAPIHRRFRAPLPVPNDWKNSAT